MPQSFFVPRGAASFRVAYDGPPRDYYFLLLPKLTLLAFTSALEPLRVANQIAGKELYRWYVMTGDNAPVTCSCGVNITPDTPLRDVPRDAAAFVCAGIEPLDTLTRRAVTWISRQRAFGCMAGGICTGAFALARAGLLEGRRFKTVRGMGSLSAMEEGSADRYSQEGQEKRKLVPEGIEARVPYKGPVSDTIFQLIGGLRSGMGYVGAGTLTELAQVGRFIRVTSGGLRESHPHDVTITREAPNYHL